MWLKSLVTAALIALVIIPAAAQTAPAPAPAAAAPAGTPTRVRGTIETFDGKTLSVKSREGQDIAIALADKLTLRAVKRAKLTQIKEGDFVGIAAVADAGGKMHAQEVVVFPEAMRGTAEGHFPWDLAPGSSMTNGTVGQVSKVSHDRVLQVQYKDGGAEIDVAPGTPIVTFVDATPKLLKPGRAVFVSGRKMDDGSIVSGFVVVQRGKTKPPM
jgi:hypothetical protein